MILQVFNLILVNIREREILVCHEFSQEEVNQHLKDTGKMDLIDYIDSNSFNPKKHLNNSMLYLNEKGSYKLNSVFLSYMTTSFKYCESECPVGKDSLYVSVPLNQSDNETKESDSTTLPSSNLNAKIRYFGEKLKSLRINNINQVIINQININ